MSLYVLNLIKSGDILLFFDFEEGACLVHVIICFLFFVKSTWSCVSHWIFFDFIFWWVFCELICRLNVVHSWFLLDFFILFKFIFSFNFFISLSLSVIMFNLNLLFHINNTRLMACHIINFWSIILDSIVSGSRRWFFATFNKIINSNCDNKSDHDSC